MKLDEKYADFNNELFAKLLESRSNLSKALKEFSNDNISLSTKLDYIIVQEKNKVIEYLWKSWENVYYHEESDSQIK